MATLLITLIALILVAVGTDHPIIGFVGGVILLMNGLTALGIFALVMAFLGALVKIGKEQ